LQNELRDVAIAFSSSEGDPVGEPLLVTVTGAQRFYDNTTSTSRYVFDISQRRGQELANPLSGLFQEGSTNQTAIFGDCLMAVADIPPPRSGLGPNDPDGDGTQAPVIDEGQASGALVDAANSLPNAANSNSEKELAAWQKFLKDNNINTAGKALDPKDWIGGGTTAIKNVANFVQQCITNGCDSKQGVDALGALILGLGTLIGVAFP